jgi:mRNA interferase MazF
VPIVSGCARRGFVRSSSGCPTTDPTEAPLFRLPLDPSERNGLREPCRLMVDKITTISKPKLGRRIGELDPEDLVRLNRAVLVFLGLASSPPRAGREAR